MAWIMVWRAVHNAEMTRCEALPPEWRLMRLDAFDTPSPESDDMEPRLRRLPDNSLTLNTGLARLERQMMGA